MSWVPLAVGVVGTLGASLWAMAERIRAVRAAAEAVRARIDAVASQVQATDLGRRLAESEAGAADAARRLETVVSRYRSEVASLSVELAACQDPAAVRARLGRLFQGA